MNQLEKLVYDQLKSNPQLKFLVRNLYQSAYDLLPNKKNYSHKPIQAREGYFYGFHDLSPFSSDDSKVLANRLLIPLRMPGKQDALEVGYFEFSGDQLGEFVKIGETTAWNYHKGCRLQWAGEQKLIFNDELNGSLVSRMVDVTGNDEVIMPYAIDSVSACGEFASSFSYGRLEMTMPGYGYMHDDESFKSVSKPEQTGLFLCRLRERSRELLISLHDLDQQWGLKEHADPDAHLYVTHTLFSPDSKYLSFLVRATNMKDVSKRWTQLGVYELASGAVHFSATDDMVSHYVWNSQNQIVAYSRTAGVDSHVLFQDPELQDYQRVAYPALNSDGHQSFIDNNSFVTDTYPDKYRMAKLYRVSIASDEAQLIASVNSYKKFQSKLPFKHWCCDLHPRVNNRGDMVCFDSVHTGERALCIMAL